MLLESDKYPSHGTVTLCYWDSRRVRWMPVKPKNPELTEEEKVKIAGGSSEQDRDSG